MKFMSGAFAVAEILRELGHDPDEIMVYDNTNLSVEVRDHRDLGRAASVFVLVDRADISRIN